jgi:hypothetical protein
MCGHTLSAQATPWACRWALDSPLVLRFSNITELPGHIEMYKAVPKDKMRRILSHHGVMFDEGEFDFKPPHSLREINSHRFIVCHRLVA